MACREINPTPKQYAIKSDWNECRGSHELQGMCVCVCGMGMDMGIDAKLHDFYKCLR